MNTAKPSWCNNKDCKYARDQNEIIMCTYFTQHPELSSKNGINSITVHANETVCSQSECPIVHPEFIKR